MNFSSFTALMAGLLAFSFAFASPTEEEVTAAAPVSDQLEESRSQSVSKYKKKKKRKKKRRRKKRRSRRTRVQPTSQSEEVVDLSQMGSGDEETAGNDSGYGYGGRLGKGLPQPAFRMHFDLLLHRRPGVSPITFDNYHTILMLEISPTSKVHFGFEVRPTPRYFELDYDLTEEFQIRIGRIWIPFDQMEPHSLYGGWINASQLIHPGGTAFLPDIWTDLGVGIRYQPIDSKYLGLETHLYVVNGFAGGQVDPAAAASDYPDFGAITKSEDNNGDKAVGARAHFMLFRTFGMGVSIYTGRWADDELAGTQAQNDEANPRIYAVGVDAQLHLGTGSVLRAGYMGMTVGMVPPVQDQTMTRGAVYGELSNRIFDRWQLVFRGGSAQNDNRVIDVTDKTIVGAALHHRFDSIFRLGVEHYRDLNRVATKTNYTFSALRFSITL